MAYTLISEQVLGSAAASVTFSSIPGTYKDLVLEMVGSLTTGTATVALQFNSDTATNYSGTILTGNGTTAASSRTSTVNSMQIGYLGADIGTDTLQVQSYASTATYKTAIARGNSAGNMVQAGVGLWRSTTAVSSITVLTTASTFISGSAFRLWGVS